MGPDRWVAAFLLLSALIWGVVWSMNAWRDLKARNRDEYLWRLVQSIPATTRDVNWTGLHDTLLDPNALPLEREAAEAVTLARIEQNFKEGKEHD